MDLLLVEEAADQPTVSWWRRRPVSRVLSPAMRPGDGHSSGTCVAAGLARPTRTTGPETGLVPHGLAAAAPSSLLGLAPGGVCRAADIAAGAVRSCRTLSPLPAGPASRPDPGGRSALCGTFPGVAPAGDYPAPCFRGARTFLPRPMAGAAIRPPDHPQCRVWDAPAQAFRRAPAGRRGGRASPRRHGRRSAPDGSGAGRRSARPRSARP
jgi:hypothetical protein